MPVLSRCQLCSGVMPDALGEARCPRCGEMVLPVIRKLCAGCAADVTRTKRTRDDAGEYYCADCWAARLAAGGEASVYPCGACGQLFPPDQIYRDGDDQVCGDCYRQRNVDPNALLAAAAAAGDDGPAVFAPASTYRQPAYRQPAEFPWGWLSFGIAVLVATVGAVVLLSLR